MKRGRHSDDEILTLLDEARRGVSIEVICASAHISERTFYRWKKRLDGVSPKGLEHLAHLEREVARLKRQLTLQTSISAASAKKLAKRTVLSRPDIGPHVMDAKDVVPGTQGLGARLGRFSSVRTVR